VRYFIFVLRRAILLVCMQFRRQQLLCFAFFGLCLALVCCHRN
jgi:hypothetical protein